MKATRPLVRCSKRRQKRLARMEQLENRLLLATDLLHPVSEYIVFAQESAQLSRASSLDSLAPVGSNVAVLLGRDVSTGEVKAGQLIETERDISVDGDVLSGGHVLFGSGAQVVGNIDATENVQFGANASIEGTVTAGTWVTFAQRASVEGDVRANETIRIDRNSTVSGNVVLPDPETNLLLARGVRVTGEIITGVVAPDSFEEVKLPAALTFDANSDADVVINANETVLLEPGAYEDVTVSPTGTLMLQTGRYVIRSLAVETGAQLDLQFTEGAIDLFVEEDAFIGKGLSVVVNGDAAQDADVELAKNLYSEVHGSWNLEPESSWFGTVYAPFGNVNIARDSSFVGALYSGMTATVQKSVTGTYQVADRFLAPTITASLANDTGVSSTDGITYDPSVTGQAIDGNLIQKLQVALDDTSETAFVEIPIDARTGEFTLDTALLLDAGIELLDGSHTLFFRAEDEFGNQSLVFSVDFVLDTTVATPTIVEIADDTGGSASDAITSDNTLLFFGMADADSTITLHEATLGDLGTTNSSSDGGWMVDATGTTLADGDYSFTSTAEDIAGNVSDPSSPFPVQIDTVPPELPEFDLDAESDTAPVGDRQTTLSSVVLAGVTDAEVAVELVELQLQTTSDALGAFSFSDIPLALGENSFTMLATDLAGNTSEFNGSVFRTAGEPPELIAAFLGSEPSNGNVDVGVTVNPKVFFSAPIVGSSLTEDNFFASFSGEKLPGNITPSSDGTFAWLFLDDEMPSASQIEITVDGSSIRTEEGSPPRC